MNSVTKNIKIYGCELDCCRTPDSTTYSDDEVQETHTKTKNTSDINMILYICRITIGPK